jgi:hypothetical protein
MLDDKIYDALVVRQEKNLLLLRQVSENIFGNIFGNILTCKLLNTK